LNPYVSATLAMCVIVILSLIATAYMAVFFNKRAKGDLLQSLGPLAEVVDGELNLEDAFVKGKFEGHIAEGRMATSIIGAGRVFHTSVIDGAGGSKWVYYAVPPKSTDDPLAVTFESDDPNLESQMGGSLRVLVEPYGKRLGWTRVEYDPAPGHVRITRPMRTRHDIPSVEEFKTQLETVVAAATLNRTVQHPEPK
jgi:hypothetical protein